MPMPARCGAHAGSGCVPHTDSLDGPLYVLCVCVCVCVCVYVCMCVCVCVCVCVTAGGVRAQRGPGGLRRNVDQITAAVLWGSDAESVCGRVGLIVAPESGAYTVACIDLRTFQEELPHYIALKTKHMFTLDAATP